MHSEKIVAISIFVIIIILSIINYTSSKSLITDPSLLDELIDEEYRSPTSIEDILPIDSVVQPILYANVTFIDQLSTPKVKETFINIMVPAILIAKKEINFQRAQVQKLKSKPEWAKTDSTFLLPLFDRYRAKNIDQLLKRMRTHPTSIVLGQAAIESGWGRSRFFKEANNVFGLWSVNPNEDRIEAKIQRGDQKIFLKKYPNTSACIKDYFLTVGKVGAYQAFRDVRARSSTVQDLIPKLDKYSERGQAYVKDLEDMIRINNFEQYDSYRLDPNYIKYDLPKPD